MGAFKYETIMPPASRSEGKLAALKTDMLEKERNDAYAKGFKDGVNVTKDAVEVETNRLLSRINEDLSDIQFTNEQASSAVMKSVQPLISAIVEQLSPTVLRDRLLEGSQEILAEILRDHRGMTVEIEVAPDLQEALKTVAADFNLNITVTDNPAMHDLEVRLNWQNGYDHLDMEALRQNILEKMNDYVDCLSEDADERRCEPG